MLTSALNVEPKNYNAKSGKLCNARSQSSLSSISSKTLFPKAKSKELSNKPSEICLEVTQMSKSKHDLEEMILAAMQEMKTLKSVSKNLKDKEHEMESLQNSLLRSNEELQESKSHLENSEKMINEIFRHLQNDDEVSLAGLHSTINTQHARIRQKRNSLIIDDLHYKNDYIKNTIKTTRDVKIRSPYFSHPNLHFVSTPKAKRITYLKPNPITNKSTSKLKETKIGITDPLQFLLIRTMRVLDLLSK